MKELTAIQSRLKAPKSEYNSFGRYNYRTCEGILEAVKPLCAEYECCLILTDILHQAGDRYYIRAKAVITNKEGVSIETIGCAREPLSKKGMDESQITGSTSSYARKYALNGLFAIDDTKDADYTYEVKVNKDSTRQVYKVKNNKDLTRPVNPLVNKINNCETLKDLKVLWSSLGVEERAVKEIIIAKENAKKRLD